MLVANKHLITGALVVVLGFTVSCASEEEKPTEEPKPVASASATNSSAIGDSTSVTAAPETSAATEMASSAPTKPNQVKKASPDWAPCDNPKWALRTKDSVMAMCGFEMWLAKAGQKPEKVNIVSAGCAATDGEYVLCASEKGIQKQSTTDWAVVAEYPAIEYWQRESCISEQEINRLSEDSHLVVIDTFCSADNNWARVKTGLGEGSEGEAIFHKVNGKWQLLAEGGLVQICEKKDNFANAPQIIKKGELSRCDELNN